MDKFTQKDTDVLEDDIKNIVRKLKQFDSPSDACEFAIIEILSVIAHNHFEGIGIFEEAKLQWRKLSLDVIDETNNDNEEKANRYIG